MVALVGNETLLVTGQNHNGQPSGEAFQCTTDDIANLANANDIGITTANVLEYGAIGDGVTHPLSNYYSTLAAAQAEYPSAQSLSDELDMVAFEKAMATGLPNIYLPNASTVSTAAYLINRQVTLPYVQTGRQGFIRIYGDGSATNGRRYITTIRRTVSNAGINIIGVSRATAPNSNDLYKYPRLETLCLDGGWSQYNTTADYPMLNMNAVYEAIFTDMTVVNTLGHGILMREVWDSRFHDIRLQTSGQHQGYQKDVTFNGTTTAVVSSTTGLFAGQRIYGAGVQNLIISSISNSTNFICSASVSAGTRTCAFEAKAAVHICSNNTTTATSNNLVMTGFRIEACPGASIRVQGLNVVDIFIRDFKAENNEISMDSAIDVDGASAVLIDNAWTFASPQYYNLMTFTNTTAGKTLASLSSAAIDSFTLTGNFYTSTGTLTASSNAVTGLADTSTLKVGQFISGTGITAASLSGVCVASITGPNSITMTDNATASSAGTKTLTFSYPYDSGVFYRRGFYTGVSVICYDADDPRNYYMGKVCAYDGQATCLLSLAVDYVFGDTSKSITNWVIAMAHSPLTKFRNAKLCRGYVIGQYPGGPVVTTYPYLQAFNQLDGVNGYDGLTLPVSGQQCLPNNSFKAYTSSSSVLIGTGAKTFTIATGIPSDVFSAGKAVFASGFTQANAQNNMTGTVTSYNSGTGALVINVPTGGTAGSGTLTSWSISSAPQSSYLQTGSNVDVVARESHYLFGTPATGVNAVQPILSDSLSVSGAGIIKNIVPITAGLYATITPDSKTLYVLSDTGGIYLGSTVITAVGNITLSTPSTDLTVSGTLITLTAGENLAFGDIVYIKSDGLAWKADANAAGLFPAIGMATATVLASASASIFIFGIARNDAWSWAVGAPVYLSTTTGGITQSQPSATDDCIQVLGFAQSATTILFRPSPDYITHT